MNEDEVSTIALQITSAEGGLIALALYRMESQDRVARSVALARGAEDRAHALDLRRRAINRLRERLDVVPPP